MAQTSFLAFLRKLSLFLLLIFVATGAYLSQLRATDWEDTLWIAVYPINGDGSEKAATYIESLNYESFSKLDQFVQQEAERYGLDLSEPMRFDLGTPIYSQPPLPPQTGSVFDIAWWSLQLRYWASDSTESQTGPTPDVKIFVRYFDPESSPVLGHSVGLEKGLIGIVNAFAVKSQQGSNQFVILHEVMHTLGASDKYDRANQPVFPQGYAEPELQPTHPQRYAEIMGGRIPLSRSTATTPESLKQARIGMVTAMEINWLKQE